MDERIILFKKLLSENGYKEFPLGGHAIPGTVANLSKRLEGASPCHTNDKTFVIVSLYQFSLHANHVSTQVRFDIRGQFIPNLWCNLEVYAVPLDQAIQDFALIEEKLRMAWEIIYESA